MNVVQRPRFKIDEDLPFEVVEIMRTAGHDAATVFMQGMQGWPDERLWTAVASEGRSLMTANVGFADARRLVGTVGVGIVLFRLWPESRSGYIRLAENFITSYSLDQVPAA